MASAGAEDVRIVEGDKLENDFPNVRSLDLGERLGATRA